MRFFFSPCPCHKVYTMDMADQIYEKVIQALLKALEEADLTQDELAHKCGTTQPTIQRLLAGKRGQNLPFKTVLNIALALDIDLSSLVSPHSFLDKREKIASL